MSLVALFVVGSVLFFATTWSTVAFGLSRMHELQSKDIASSDDVKVVDNTAFTEFHVETSDASATDTPS